MIQQDQADYIADNGFSARVLDALPRTGWRTERRRVALLLGATGIGCAIAGALTAPSFSADCLGLTQRFTSATLAPSPGAAAVLSIGSMAILAAAVASGRWTFARSR
jgi:hypothetical protein